jgi:hypothetical protein
MFRQVALITLGLSAIVNLNAAGIQIGQVVSGINDGLTSTYIGAGSTNFTLSNYDTTVFSGATLGGVPPTPFTGYSNTAGVPPTVNNTTQGVLTDVANNVTFDMISSPGSNGDAWVATGASASITVPVGIFGVVSAWTMLNDIWGSAGVNTDTIVTFHFGTGTTVGSITETLTVNLVNGVQIRDAVDCLNGGTPPCASEGYSTSLTPNPSTIATTGNGSGILPSLTVVTNRLYSTGYNGGATGEYTGTTGNLVLDDQGFKFGSAFNNLYLVNIVVTSNYSNLSTAAALSAVTVFTPEPSTILLCMGGFGLLGFARLRRKQ